MRLLLLLVFLGLAAANTETFQVQLPGESEPLAADVALHGVPVPIAPDTHPVSVHLSNLTAEATPVTISVGSGVSVPLFPALSRRLGLKVCWTAAVPVAVVPGSLRVWRHSDTETRVQFAVVREAVRPERAVDVVLNVSLSPLWLGVMPGELLPVLGAVGAVVSAVSVALWRCGGVCALFSGM